MFPVILNIKWPKNPVFFEDYPPRTLCMIKEVTLNYRRYIPTLLQDLGSSKSRSRSSRTQQYAAAARSIFPAHILNYRRYSRDNEI